MDLKRWLAAGCLVALAACKGECSCGTTDDDGDTTASSGVGGFGGGDSTSSTSSTSSTVTGTTTSASTGGGPVGSASVRVGNLAVDVDAVDFCLNGANIVGAEGRQFGAVSAYFEVDVFDEPTQTLSVVAAGGDCAGEALAAGGVDLVDGAFVTLVLQGGAESADFPLAIAGYADDIAAPQEGNVIIQFTQLALPPNPENVVSIGTENSDGVFEPLDPAWENLAFGDSAPPLETDAGEIELIAIVKNNPESPDGLEAFRTTIDLPSEAVVTAYAAGSSGDGLQAVIVTDFP